MLCGLKNGQKCEMHFPKNETKINDKKKLFIKQ